MEANPTGRGAEPSDVPRPADPGYDAVGTVASAF
jgi:hypothetical protein